MITDTVAPEGGVGFTDRCRGPKRSAHSSTPPLLAPPPLSVGERAERIMSNFATIQKRYRIEVPRLLNRYLPPDVHPERFILIINDFRPPRALHAYYIKVVTPYGIARASGKIPFNEHRLTNTSKDSRYLYLFQAGEGRARHSLTFNLIYSSVRLMSPPPPLAALPLPVPSPFPPLPCTCTRTS